MLDFYPERNRGAAPSDGLVFLDSNPRYLDLTLDFGRRSSLGYLPYLLSCQPPSYSVGGLVCLPHVWGGVHRSRERPRQRGPRDAASDLR